MRPEQEDTVDVTVSASHCDYLVFLLAESAAKDITVGFVVWTITFLFPKLLFLEK